MRDKELQARWGYPTVYTILRYNSKKLIYLSVDYKDKRHWWIRFFGKGFCYNHGKISFLK